MAGRILAWMDYSLQAKKILVNLLKATGLDYDIKDYKKGVIPFLDINTSTEDVIIALGANPLQELKNHGLVKKNLTIGSSSKTPYVLPCGAKCLTSYSPTIRNVDYSLYVELQADIKLAARLASTGSMAPPELDFKWVYDLNAPLAYIDSVRGTRTSLPIAVDLETTGLVAYSPDTWIVTFQMSYDTKSSFVIRFDSDFQPEQPKGEPKTTQEVVWTQINTLLNDPFIKTRGANLKYDLMWIAEKWGIECTNFSMDTLLVGSLLDENRSNSLKTHASIYTQYGNYELDLYKKYDIAKPHEVPPEVLLPYCGYDTTVCLEVSEEMIQELKQYPDLMYFYKEILHPAARAYERVERVGIKADTKYYGEFKADLEGKLKELNDIGSNLIPGRIKIKHSDNPSLTRAAMLGDLFFNHGEGFNLKPVMFTPKPDKKTGKPKNSTAMEHFLKFKDYAHEPPKKPTKKTLELDDKARKAREFVGIIEQYKDIEKTLGTYVDGFLKHLRPDGRFHGTYFLFKGGDTDNGTNCLPAGELVLTSRGYLPIENVLVDDQVITHTGKPCKVIATLKNGIKPIIKATLSNGLTLRTTFNHMYYKDDGSWATADTLKVGDAIQCHSTPEEWEVIPQWEDFQVSSWGRVFNTKSKRMMTQYAKGKWGHLKVTLARNGAQDRGADRKDYAVHKLVANAFVPQTDIEVRHLNGFAWDNTVGNISWGSSKENRQDAVKHGAMSRRNGNQNKLTESDIAVIRNSTATQEKLSKHFGVSRRLIGMIKKGERWGDTPYREKKASFFSSTVMSLEIQPEEFTYGIEVENEHSHVTGGIVTHNTGRVSVIDPAVQTIPKNTKWAKPLRRAFIAPEGFIVANCDFSQGELRIAADLANEEKMLWAYNHGIDLHAVTGASLAGIDLDLFMSYKNSEDPEEIELFKSNRQKAKGANFGLLYGMGAEGFRTYAETAYGVKMTDKEAVEAREKFFVTYPRLQPWHEECKAEARAKGYVVSPLGRIRHLPQMFSPDGAVKSREERRSINSRVQGTLSDMSLWATAIMEQEGLTKEAPVIAMVHDALMFYLPKDNWRYFAKRYLEIMQNLPFAKVGWVPKLKFESDLELSFGDPEKGIPPNFADLHSLKELKLTLE